MKKNAQHTPGITRTFTIADITPQELATTFLDWNSEEQAAFFNAFKAETDKWPGAGWCQQSCEISRFLEPSGIETILKLGEWAAEPYVTGEPK